MIWKVRVYSKWLIFSGFFLLLFFACLAVLSMSPDGIVISVVSVVITFFWACLSLRGLRILLNPVLLRLDDEGVYLRGEIFVPYKDVLAFTKEKRLIPQAGGYLAIYKLLLTPSAALSAKEIFTKTKFIFFSVKDKNGVIHITFPPSYAVSPSYEQVLGEMFNRYRNKTGNILSSNYYPDMHEQWKV